VAGIYSALGELDRIRKMAGRRVKDVVKDPLGVLTQQADDLRNTQRGLDPVINAAGAGMRQIPREEQVSRMTQQALDTYAGGLGMLGHTVFHGSPRAFSKFDKAKMGTGEGNAAFGKGLYVAENPDVAKEYLNVGLKIDPGKATYGGKKIQSLYDAAQRKQDLGHRTRNQSMIDEANAELSYWEDLMVGTHPAAARERAANPDSGWPTLQKFAESIDDKKFKGVDFPDSSLYKVDIPDEVVPQMLDWDKSFKEQPARVQTALKKLGVTQPAPAPQETIEAAKEAYRANPSRENLQAMNALMNQGRNIMGSDIIKRGLATEEALQQAGIPGIKYLDAGSREGGGTSNMVVFSPEMMRILERNGEATGAKPWAAGEWGGKPGGFLDTAAEGGPKIKGRPSMLSLRGAAQEADAAIEKARSGGPAIVNRQTEPLRFFPQTESPYIQGVAQTLPARAEPRMKGGVPQYNARTQDLINDPWAEEAIRRNIERGQHMGMQEWYGTAPLKAAAAAEGLSEEEFNRMMLHLASASQRSPVEGQIKRGSMTWFADRQGLLAPDAPEFTFPKGYGSLAQKNILENAREFAAGGTLDESKKLGRFHQNLMGNLDPVTVDVMALRGPIMATRDPRWLANAVRSDGPNGITIERPRELFASGQMTVDDALNRPGFWEPAPKGPEYGAVEDMYRGVAQKMGIAPAESQAAAWYGSGIEAGLRSQPRTFMQAIEDRVAFTAQQRGETPLQTLAQFIRGDKPLMAIGGGGMIGYDQLRDE